MITSNTDIDLAKRIRQIRIDNHLTQDQVAKHLMRPPAISATWKTEERLCLFACLCILQN